MLNPHSIFRVTSFALMMAVMSVSAVTRDDVLAGAEQLYQARLVEAKSGFRLDNDQAFLLRVQRIAAGLIIQASHDDPAAEKISWEIHTSDDPDETASCMAGGKLLIGQQYVTRLELNDAELAMVLAHEMEHALLEHNYKEFQQALVLEPSRQQSAFSDLEYAVDHDVMLMRKLNELNQSQETEADLEGMRLAWRAGWPAVRLTGFFKKVLRADRNAFFNRPEHPSPALRLRAAAALADELNQLPATK